MQHSHCISLHIDDQEMRKHFKSISNNNVKPHRVSYKEEISKCIFWCIVWNIVLIIVWCFPQDFYIILWAFLGQTPMFPGNPNVSLCISFSSLLVLLGSCFFKKATLKNDVILVKVFERVLFGNIWKFLPYLNLFKNIKIKTLSSSLG